MGRWLKKIENVLDTKLTKPTKQGYVSFVSDAYSNLSVNPKTNILNSFVQDCCSGFKVEALDVINHLISNEDEEDIVTGHISKACLILHIQLWMAKGQPAYSGKFQK